MLERLVGQHGQVANTFQMPDRRMDVDRLDRIAAGAVHDIVHLRELEEIAVVLLVARAAAIVGIRAVRRRPHLEMIRLLPPNRTLCPGFRACSVNSDGQCAIRFEDQVVVEMHALVPWLTSAPGSFMISRAPSCRTSTPISCKHSQRGEVDQFQLVIGNDFGRPQRNFQLAERRLVEGGAVARALAGAPAATAAAGGENRFCGLNGGVHCFPHGVDAHRIMNRGPSSHCGGDDH